MSKLSSAVQATLTMEANNLVDDIRRRVDVGAFNVSAKPGIAESEKAARKEFFRKKVCAGLHKIKP